MDCLKFSRLVRYWGTNKTGQRLGQYLINQLEPPVTDPEIFYMKNNQDAKALFFERYVTQS